MGKDDSTRVRKGCEHSQEMGEQEGECQRGPKRGTDWEGIRTLELSPLLSASEPHTLQGHRLHNSRPVGPEPWPHPKPIFSSLNGSLRKEQLCG